jgi:hypothetical protein
VAVLCAALFAVGALAGAIAGSSAQTPVLYARTARGAAAFAESFVKHGRTLVVLWLLGFLPPFAPAGALLVGYKGVSLGFAGAIAVRCCGAYSIFSVAPQGCVTAIAYTFAACQGVAFNPTRNETLTMDKLIEYTANLLLAAGMIAVAAGYEMLFATNFLL